MKFNKILVACIFLLAIATMGAVCASENVTDDAAAIEDTGELIAQPEDVEIISSADDSQDALGDDFDGVEAKIDNITAYDWHRIIVSGEIKDKSSNGVLSVYVDEFSTDVPQFSLQIKDGAFVEDPKGGFTVDNLNIAEFKNYTITVKYSDHNKNAIHHLKTEKITMAYLDSFYETDTIFETYLNVRLIEGFNGTVSASINGIDVGEINCEYDSYWHCMNAQIQLDPTVLRMADNILTVTATHPVMGDEKMEFKFDCAPEVINAKEFFTTRTLAHDAQFFSIGEAFNIGIKVPEVITGKLNVYAGIYDESTGAVKKGSFLATADIYNGTAVATLSSNTPGYNDLYLECDSNRGVGHTDTFEKIVENTPTIHANVTPVEFIVGDANVTVNFISPVYGILDIYVDGDGNTFEEVNSFNYTIPYLDIGKHVIRLKFENVDEDVYSKSFTVEVKPWVPTNITVPTKITAPKVSATYNAAKDLVITLRDEWGQILVGEEISLKVGTISKKAKTDGNGQLKVNVATLTPKDYTATIKYAGSESYAPSDATAKVTVSKAKPTITAAKKTFKVKAKTKKVTATLKNNKGKILKNTKVTLKIGKKTYTAKTSSKGVATFSVKLTKKGSYTGTVKFAGSSYYKAVSKTVSIKVK